MSPKGGIKPHKRFSIQAKRSEVLFVDYMAEHLTPTGRAGIIVPEGIIFQSQTAYKDLRKMLVNNALVAVVSLPAGCFNPYSVVKTSILILDKSLARGSDTIAFFKVENDGFGLGAQRRAVAGEQLTQVKAELDAYLQALRSGGLRAKGEPFDTNAASRKAKGPTSSQPVATPQENAPQDVKGLKARLISRADDGSGFQPSNPLAHQKPGALPQAGMDCAVGAHANRAEGPINTSPGQRPGNAIPPHVEGLKARPISKVCLIVPKEKIAANGDYNLSGERYREGVVVTAAWPMVPLGDVTRRVSGGTPSKENDAFWRGNIPWVSPKDMKEDVLSDTEDHVSESAVEGSATSLVPAGTLLCVVRSGILKHSLPLAITAREMCFNQDLIALIPTDGRLEVRFLFWMLKARSREILETGIKPGVTVQSFHTGFFSQLQIPLPPLEVQKEIVAEIEGYQKVINGARAVLDHYRPHIPIHPDWPMVAVDDIVEFVSGLTVSIPEVEAEGGTPILAINNVTEDGKLTLEGLRWIKPPTKTLNYVQKGDLLFNWRNGSKRLVGKTAMFDLDGQYLFASFLLGIRPHRDRVDSSYLWHTLNIYRREGRYMQFMRMNVNGLFNREELRVVEIPLPPLATQQAIVAEIEAEQALVAANRELITRFEQKIQATLARVWGEEPSNPRET
jgi:restriction endonuclease S subunit